MNKKRTNYIIAISNVLTIISVYFNIDIGVLYGPSGVKSIYNSFILDTFIGNAQLIKIVIYSITGILNIVAGVQNRKNKKICFWQLIFGIYEIILAIVITTNPNLVLKRRFRKNGIHAQSKYPKINK